MGNSAMGPAEDVCDILKSAHDEDDAPAVVKRARTVAGRQNYKTFTLDESQAHKEYDSRWIYANIGTKKGEDYIGMPTRSGEAFLEVLMTDSEARLQYLMNASTLTVKGMDKRNAATSEIEKKMDDDGSCEIDFLAKYEATVIKQGLKR